MLCGLIGDHGLALKPMTFSTGGFVRLNSFVIVALTALSHALTVALFLTVRMLFGFDWTNHFAYLVLPLGAFVYGSLGSIGAGYALRWTHSAPTPPLLNPLIGAAMVSLVVYSLIIATLVSQATGGQVSVLGALVGNITDTELVYGRTGQQDDSLGAVGGWGFLLLGIKLAGAAGGAYVAYEGMLFRNSKKARDHGSVTE